jgi:alpha-methylacyl-CoA racemase
VQQSHFTFLKRHPAAARCAANAVISRIPEHSLNCFDAGLGPREDGHGGPLAGVRVVEFAGLGPGPFAAMLLADLGADVVKIERPGAKGASTALPVDRGRLVVSLDLKSAGDLRGVMDLLATADVLIEGFRPGVMERLGLGPVDVERINPQLVYGRMTGWGQTGPLARSAGHDLNYIAVTGALNAIGMADRPPVPPLNLLGDYAGGSLYLVIGILAAILEARRSGLGQVVDAAICDGTVSLLSALMGFTARGLDNGQRGRNLFDGGCPFYSVYETSDGRFITIAAIEPQFFDTLCERIALPEHLRSRQNDRAIWPEMRAVLTRIFASRSQADWEALLCGTDACFASVIALAQAPEHPHLRERATFVKCGDGWQSAPAPRLSRTPGKISPSVNLTVNEILARWGAPAP